MFYAIVGTATLSVLYLQVHTFRMRLDNLFVMGEKQDLEVPPESLLDSQVLQSLRAHSVKYEVLACDPDLADTAAFCQHYGFELEQAANTILISSKKVEPAKYAVCVVLGTTRLDVNQKVSELLSVKRLSFADAEVTQQITGMMIGGVTVFGITDLPIYIDSAVMLQPLVVMGGGNRSSKLLLNSSELMKLPNAQIIQELAKPK
jgi:prolyl-tRNA editing enzyme YbaK/EbsC (Cys-tRNA(Pro) deacylase)